MAVRHADSSGGDIRGNQHAKDKMRDIQIGKRGSEAASEDQPDKLEKTVRFEHEASSAASSSDPVVLLEDPASGETQDRPRSVLVQKSGHVDDDVQISELDVFYEMDGRKSRYIRQVLDCIVEKMPEISRKVNWMNWLRTWHEKLEEWSEDRDGWET